MDQDLHDNWHIADIMHIPDNARILVAGAYKGRVMNYFLERYNCHVTGFEPQPWAYEQCRGLLNQYDESRWDLHNKALGTYDDPTIMMGEWGTDGCSFHSTKEPFGFGSMLGAFGYLSQHEPFDLAVFNMEGYEFTLLEHLFDKPDVIRWYLRSLAVQFHLQYSTWAGYHKLIYRLTKLYPNSYLHALPQWGYWS